MTQTEPERNLQPRRTPGEREIRVLCCYCNRIHIARNPIGTSEAHIVCRGEEIVVEITLPIDPGESRGGTREAAQ